VVCRAPIAKSVVVGIEPKPNGTVTCRCRSRRRKILSRKASTLLQHWQVYVANLLISAQRRWGMEETGMAWLPICRAGRWLKKSQAFRGTVVHRHVLRMLDVACFAPRLCQFVSLSSFVDAFAEYDCYINRKSCPTYGAFLRRVCTGKENKRFRTHDADAARPKRGLG
jgi:hypothetical protein